MTKLGSLSVHIPWAPAGAGYVVVQSPIYYAWWHREEPSILYVRDRENLDRLDWIRWGIECRIVTKDNSGKLHESVLGNLSAPGDAKGNRISLESSSIKSENGCIHLTFAATRPEPCTIHLEFFHDRIEQRFETTFSRRTNLVRIDNGISGINQGSQIKASRVFDSSPSSHGLFFHEPNSSLTMRSNWFSPAPWCYPFETGDEEWLTVSLEPKKDQLQFSKFCTHKESEGVSFRIAYDAQPQVLDVFNSPPVVLRFKESSPFEGIHQHSIAVVDAGKAEGKSRLQQDWWKGVMICGWHHQMEVAQNSKSARAQDLACQNIYEEHIAKYREKDIDWDILTIDDLWSQDYAVWYVDRNKWPDMRGFIERRHNEGRKVLLWVCTWTNGLPEDEIYTTSDSDRKFLDPLNPSYLKKLEDYMQHMLGNGPEDLNADGIKLDFTGDHPLTGDHKCTKPLYGMDYLHAQIAAISNAARRVKPGCLLDYQIANPYFASLHDMTRLNDYFMPPDQALKIMGIRAKIAHAANQGGLVDMDCPDHVTYFHNMHRYGNMSLYLSNRQLDNHPEYVAAIKKGIRKFRGIMDRSVD